MRLEAAFGAASGPYLDELAEQMRQLIEASAGRAFLLFSSQRALEGVLARLEDTLADLAFVPIVQARALGRLEMLRRFRGEERAVLFGLKSFWERVYVVGHALSRGAIDKLPFHP